MIKKSVSTSKKNVHAITSPLITTANGKKMGKTDNGAIWLSEAHLSIFDFWQYWRNTLDEDVIKFLKIFTEIELDEISKLEQLKGEEINEAKVLLANSITSLTHGKSKCDLVLKSINNVMNNELKQLNILIT